MGKNNGNETKNNINNREHVKRQKRKGKGNRTYATASTNENGKRNRDTK